MILRMGSVRLQEDRKGVEASVKPETTLFALVRLSCGDTCLWLALARDVEEWVV